MKISRTRCAVALLVCLGASQAQADLLNISTTTIQSQNTSAIACTIVGTTGNTWQGLKVLQVMSEAQQGDSNPVLVAELLENGETLANDNWTGPWLANGTPNPAPSPAFFQALLRTPAGPNDAALVASVPPGWRLCVHSREVSGGDALRRVQVAVTDVTDAAIRVIGGTKDYPASVRGIPAGTPNLISTFARALNAP